MTLGAALSRTAKNHPRRVALVFEGKKYTYRELNDYSEGFAAGLAGLGVRPGDRVGILLSNSPEFAVAYFGIVKAGAAAVPLNTFLTVSELEFILADAGVEVLVSSHAFADKLPELRKHSARLRYVVAAGDRVDGTLPFDDVIRKGGRGCDVPSDSEAAAVLYTSGTTGNPKGVVLTHSNLLSNAESCAKAFRISKHDRLLLFLPMFHAFAFLVCMLMPVMVGARVLVLASVKPFSNIVKAVFLGRVTLFVAIPAVYNILSAKSFPWLLLKMTALRLCISGAAPLAGETLERFQAAFPAPLLEGYGLTEASPVVSCNPLDGKRKPGSVGLPIPGVRVKVVDENEKELPPGKVGDIIVSGPNVMKGYLGNEEATRETIRGGWLFTGDMGYVDEEGYIFIVDRKKDLILVHGMNVYPREVEEALYRHPSVKDAAVIGVHDADTEFPRAFITLKEGHTAKEAEIRTYLKERLAPYKVPRQVVIMDELPMTPTGKVLKKELKRSLG